MTNLQYNGPDTDGLKRGGVYVREEYPEVDDELWCTPAFGEDRDDPKTDEPPSEEDSREEVPQTQEN